MLPDPRTVHEQPPQRCFTLAIKVGGDTWEDTIRGLREAVDHVECAGASGGAATGGVSSGWFVEIVHRPDMTNGKYFDELTEWQAKLKEQARHDWGSAVE